MIYYQGKILFVFIGKFKINQFPNCLKACLISTKREKDVKSWRENPGSGKTDIKFNFFKINWKIVFLVFLKSTGKLNF